MISVSEKTDLWMWEPPEKPFLRAIPTNGCVRSNGHLVMGRGVAQQAAERYPDLPQRLGSLVKAHGSRVYLIEGFSLISFPTKHDWRDASRLDLILESAQQAAQLLGDRWKAIVLPRPGCGYGQLSWSRVEPVLKSVLLDKLVYVISDRV